jgi:hypothetical protein
MSQKKERKQSPKLQTPHLERSIVVMGEELQAQKERVPKVKTKSSLDLKATKNTDNNPILKISRNSKVIINYTQKYALMGDLTRPFPTFGIRREVIDESKARNIRKAKYK